MEVDKDLLMSFLTEVEDYLKDLQNGKISAIPQSIELLTTSVDTVFHLIEFIKNRQEIEDTGYKVILLRIEKISHPETRNNKDEIVIENNKDVYFLRINMERIYLPNQYKIVANTLDQFKNGKKIVLDLSKVRTINSTAWDAIWAAEERMSISAVGMRESCKATFFAWGFDHLIHAFKTEEDFWKDIGMPACW